MAYVAISEKLKTEVNELIDAKRAQELKLVGSREPLFISSTDPRLVETFWGEHKNLQNVIPKEWCQNINSVVLSITYDLYPGEPGTTKSTYLPATISGNAVFYVPPSVRVDTKIHVSEDFPGVSSYIELQRELARIVSKWAKVKSDIKSFIGSCKSLNEALRLWPDVRIYIPQEYLSRAEEKTAKTKAAESRALEILKQIDTDHAVSSAVLVRMLGANKND